jgi:hypothetical protein
MRFRFYLAKRKLRITEFQLVTLRGPTIAPSPSYLYMDYAASEPPAGPVAELQPCPVLEEAGALPLSDRVGVVRPRCVRSPDKGREQVGGALQREAAEQRLRHGPGQEREEVVREDQGTEEHL